jgi:hypothetical protein
MMYRASPIFALLPVLAILAAPAAAQEVVGFVRDEASGDPVAGAEVVLRHADGVVASRGLTGEEGRFLLLGSRAGVFTLTISRIGYQAFTSANFQVGAGERLLVEVRIGADAIPLEPLVVRHRSRQRPPDIEAFYNRLERGRRSGDGHFISRVELEGRFPARTSDLLRSMGGIQVVYSRGGRDTLVRMRGGCIPALYVDGTYINRVDVRLSLDDYVAPRSIEGIEVYRGAGRAVGHFHDPRGCGMILVWTLRGQQSGPEPMRWKTIGIVLGTLLGLFLILN